MLTHQHITASRQQKTATLIYSQNVVLSLRLTHKPFALWFFLFFLQLNPTMFSWTIGFKKFEKKKFCQEFERAFKRVGLTSDKNMSLLADLTEAQIAEAREVSFWRRVHTWR